MDGKYTNSVTMKKWANGARTVYLNWFQIRGYPLFT